MHSIVTTRRLVSLDEARVTSRTTMGRRKVHLHTRGTNVVITVPPRCFLRCEVQESFLRFYEQPPRRARGRKIERSRFWKLLTKIIPAMPSMWFSSRGLLPPFYRSCPRNGQFNVQTPGVQVRAFSLRHRAIIVRELAIYFHRSQLRGERSRGARIYLSIAILESNFHSKIRSIEQILSPMTFFYFKFAKLLHMFSLQDPAGSVRRRFAQRKLREWKLKKFHGT